jgi:hypothetical protein
VGTQIGCAVAEVGGLPPESRYWGTLYEGITELALTTLMNNDIDYRKEAILPSGTGVRAGLDFLLID